MRCRRRVRIELGGIAIADSTRALRVLERSHPPTIYVPREDVAPGVLRASGRESFCEWKGVAAYEDVVAGHVSCYPGRMDAAWLDGERVRAQPGDFYGGWITGDLRGPFKGGAGTAGW